MFRDPPLTELALAVAFEPLPALNTVAQFKLWASSYRDTYPEIEQQSASVRMPRGILRQCNDRRIDRPVSPDL